ncbi:hypothetical protein BV20DRAFT_235754 [Pilatotrama ljubarskyi]|nr:hypothetical protein BV20DRAFT_235754 [Pilatotrama ljubarskyi]
MARASCGPPPPLSEIAPSASGPVSWADREWELRVGAGSKPQGSYESAITGAESSYIPGGYPVACLNDLRASYHVGWATGRLAPGLTSTPSAFSWTGHPGHLSPLDAGLTKALRAVGHHIQRLVAYLGGEERRYYRSGPSNLLRFPLL